MVVDVERGECRHIDLEDMLLRQRGRQLRVEAVNAFNEQNLVGFQPHAVVLIHAPAQLEAVGGQIHLLAPEQRREVSLQPLQIESIQTLVVQLPVGVARRSVAVHEIVVERNHLRRQHIGHQMDAEPLCCGRLARR